MNPELDADSIITKLNNDQEELHQFEKQFVTQVYNEIAPHFSNTRYSRWPFINQYILEKENCLFADIGCGNGKYMQSWKETWECYKGNKLSKTSTNNCFIGTDISEGLAGISGNERNLEVMVADNNLLPFKSEKFDVVISVAVIHHFATPERRMNAIRELFRICKKGGEVLIYVWAFEQAAKKKTGDAEFTLRYPQQDVFVPWQLQKKFEKKSDAQSSSETEFSVTGEGAKVFKRYYHLFKEGELEDLVTLASDGSFEFEFVKSHYYEKENWGVVCKKK